MRQLFLLIIFLLSTTAFADGISVDNFNRQAVIDFYHSFYCPGDDTASGWSGSISDGDEGSVSSAYEAVTLERINYFRAMAGISTTITFREDWNAMCRKAALMMSANGMLDHFPPMSWTHYSADGAVAAGKSNLSLVNTGPQAVFGQMREIGASNFPVGHRRWLLFPPMTEMGFGGVDPRTIFSPSGCIWTQPDTPDDPVSAIGVAWPPAGFVPYPLVFNRWSFSYPEADFSAATVTVMKGASSVPVTLETLSGEFGDSTIVWTIDDSAEAKSGTDLTYTVTITGVAGMGVPTTFTYMVTQIDAEPAGAKTVKIETGTKIDPDSGILKIYIRGRNSAGCITPADQVIELLYSSSSKTSGFVALGESTSGETIVFLLSTVGFYKARIKGTSVVSNVIELKANGKVDDGLGDGGAGPIAVKSGDTLWTAMVTKKLTTDCFKKSGSDEVMAGTLSEDEATFTPYTLSKKKKKKVKGWKKKKKAARTKKEKKKYSNKIKRTIPGARKKACTKAMP